MHGKKFTVLAICSHLFNDLRHKSLILVFRVLLVQDAVLRALESGTAEAVFAVEHAHVAVIEVVACVAVEAEGRMLGQWEAFAVFVPEFPHHVRAVMRVGRLKADGIDAVAALSELITVFAVATVLEQVARAVDDAPVLTHVLPRRFCDHFRELLLRGFDILVRREREFLEFLLVFLLCVLDVANAVLFVAEPPAHQTVLAAAAIEDEGAIDALRAVDGRPAAVEFLAEHTLVRALAFVDAEGID